MSNRYKTRPIHFEDKSKLPVVKALCGSGSRILTDDFYYVTCKRCIKIVENKGALNESGKKTAENVPEKN